jgi:hypothetical protein
MDNEQDKQRSDSKADLESEIRRGRQFTPQEALARMAGPGAMKGASPVSRQQQAEVEIGTWLRSHVADDVGALKGVLHRHLKGSDLLLNNLEQPLVALADHCRRILASDDILREVVRETDVEWGRLMDERPYFETADCAPHRDDPYTVESVRKALNEALEKLPSAPAGLDRA